MKLPFFFTQASRSGPALRLTKSMPFPGAKVCPEEDTLIIRAGTFVSSWDLASAGS